MVNSGRARSNLLPNFELEQRTVSFELVQLASELAEGAGLVLYHLLVEAGGGEMQPSAQCPVA